MDYVPVLKLLSLLLLVDLGSAGGYKTYDQMRNGIDWRHYGCISPVQNQGECHASWAMSTVGAVEAHLAIKNRRLVELSAQQLIDCSAYNFGCDGGWPSKAFNYTVAHGLTSKASYPYRSEQSTCRYDPHNSVGSISSYVTLRGVDEKRLAEVVYNIGPVVASIDSRHDSFAGYKSGVFTEPDCRLDMAYLTAAVLIVGFGTDNQFGDYWILKTSFGQNWGENGYMRLARNANNMCGVATLAHYPVV